jgi:hypothetical protein
MWTCRALKEVVQRFQDQVDLRNFSLDLSLLSLGDDAGYLIDATHVLRPVRHGL